MNPAGFPEQVRRAWAIAKKDIRIYYIKGPVLIFGIFMPVFLFLAFLMGSRQLPLAFLVSGLVGMALFFTATAVSPAIFPWEGQAKTLERLASCPITVEAIVFGDMIASTLFGIGITLITVIIGLVLGLSLLHAVTLGAGILLAACCFSAIGMLLAVPPTNTPSNIMMLSSLIKFPLVFISGIFIPLEQMPPWGLALAVCSPLTYFTDLVRYSFTGTNYFPVLGDIAALIVFTLIFTAGTMYLHKRTMPKRM
ncbi:MAG: ABC transporter permease [Methanoregulaceae archaeon]|jgi:ABC-2 type transport system permease protein|nr:ABC transporter permease [Methanoregulaceae archaeon]MCC7469091.1 ABC transporter permease [Burkholderiaceae bacterium]NLH25082.1 ABC transporter permease [Methanomicrobiales archaeon]HNO08561.1 ABC transporter permease [Methanoregulaceae archaeon]HPS21831.1 ABC transporter permease [Methanoregulaceae archaeon]